VKPTDVHPESVISDEPVGRASMSSNRRSSIAFEDIDSVSRGRTEPHTPSDESKAGFLSASRRGSRTWLGTKSRPTSQSGEGRLSLTLSRLTGRGSKDKLAIAEDGATDDPVIVINSVESQDHSPPEVSSPVKEQKESTLSRKKSKKGKKDHHRSKSRDPTGELSEKSKDKNRPDRECSVM
jgi:hypothetical protein